MLEQFFIASLLVQLLHSIEELTTGFHKKWYLFKMPFWAFLSFELAFSAFWIFVLFSPELPHREGLQTFFIFLMLANGLQHIIWAVVVKKYVPGFITAFGHLAVSLVFAFKILF
ncbi:MAG TPA: HXXEE domain-containing protein [Candidatus Paceibacterota bacterium]